MPKAVHACFGAYRPVGDTSGIVETIPLIVKKVVLVRILDKFRFLMNAQFEIDRLDMVLHRMGDR